MCSCWRSRYNKDIFGFALMGTSQEPSVGEKYNFPSALIVLCRVFGSVNPIKGAAFGELSGSYQHCTLAAVFPPPRCPFGNWNVLGSFILPVRGHTGCPPFLCPPEGSCPYQWLQLITPWCLEAAWWPWHCFPHSLLLWCEPAADGDAQLRHRQRHIQTLLTPRITKMPFFFI